MVTFLPPGLLFQTLIIVCQSFKSNTTENGQEQQDHTNHKDHLIPVSEHVLVEQEENGARNQVYGNPEPVHDAPAMRIRNDSRTEKTHGGKINTDCNFKNYESREGEGIVMGTRMS